MRARAARIAGSDAQIIAAAISKDDQIVVSTFVQVGSAVKPKCFKLYNLIIEVMQTLYWSEIWSTNNGMFHLQAPQTKHEENTQPLIEVQL